MADSPSSPLDRAAAAYMTEPRSLRWQRIGERIGIGLWIVGCVGFALFLIVVIAPRVV